VTKREFDEFKESDCPCGKGQITRHVESTDYRFTSFHITYSLDCNICKNIWRLDHGTLVHKESEAPYLAAREEYYLIKSKLHELAKQLVKFYFENISFKSKKEELEHLQEIGMCNLSYASFTKARREGKPISEIAHPFNNEELLMRVALERGCNAEFSKLVQLSQELNAQTENACKKIIRRGFR
jgi:ABC-type methionine transport system ATPase subunit